MKRTERLEDIQNRHSLALAERNLTEPGTENYKTLVECARLIRTEYTSMANRKNRNRYGFRCYNGKYHIVTLNKDEKY